MLQWLRSRRYLDSLAFGGGTMLRLCHELPRYSLDLDFWFYREADYEKFYNRLCDNLKLEYDVTDAQNKFYSILVEIRREKRTPRLKVEIRKKLVSPGDTEQKIAFSSCHTTQVLVRGFTLKRMLKNKIRALIERAEIRDAFDLEFLLRRGVPFELIPEDRERIKMRLKGFKKRDFDVKLGSILLPELREYYRKQRFVYLEEKLSFERWSG
jgi:predicted nucleotidyltransferase component of viral defense system